MVLSLPSRDPSRGRRGASRPGPDLIGFGKSDKPALREAHTFAGQVAWIRHWIGALDLRDITLVCQDWGSLIGLRLAAESSDRFARIILGNGGLPAGDIKIPTRRQQ